MKGFLKMSISKFDNCDIAVNPLSFDSTDIEIHPSFLSLAVDWFSLPLEYRLRLKLELIGEPIYYPDEANFLNLIIPIDNGKIRYTEVFLFLTEFGFSLRRQTDLEIAAELEKLVQGKETDIAACCKRISLIDDSKLLTLSARIEPFDISNL